MLRLVRKPVITALSLLPGVVGRARSLPTKAARLLDLAEDRVETVVKRTPAAGIYERAEDLAEGAVAQVRQLRGAATPDGAAPDVAAVPDAESAKGAPTPSQPHVDSTRIDTAASPEVLKVVEKVAAAADVETPAHGDLPLADYDHMTLGTLRGRIRSLPVEHLVQLRDYEKAHADRLPVMTLLDNRIAKLATTSE